MNCKYYCTYYQLEGVCNLHSNWSDPMPIIKYCSKSPCGDYKECLPTYEELYEHWLKTKDKPKKKRKVERLPGQLDVFDVIDNKTE